MNSYPSKSQKLLLKTVFSSQEEIHFAWEKWYTNVDIEELDEESYHLLSSLYYQLSQHQIKTEEDQRLKGIYRRHWYINNLYLKELTQILATFNHEQIKTIILGDFAINLGYYPELPMRSLHNYELFVIPKQADLAIQLLIKLGWKPKFKIDNLNHLYPKLSFTNNQGKILFLYWELWTNKLDFNNQEAIFQNITKKIIISNYETYILNPTEQIINLCLQNVLSPLKMQIRWLMDFNYIITSANSEIDWQKLLNKIQTLNLSLSFQNLMKASNEVIRGKIPADLQVNIDNLTVNYIEKHEFKIINSTNISKINYKLNRLYLLYFRTLAHSKIQLNLLEFIYYLKFRFCTNL